jgi:hypothetical protein
VEVTMGHADFVEEIWGVPTTPGGSLRGGSRFNNGDGGGGGGSAGGSTDGAAMTALRAATASGVQKLATESGTVPVWSASPGSGGSDYVQDITIPDLGAVGVDNNMNGGGAARSG